MTELNLRRRVQPLAADDRYLLRQGILKLLSIKDSDVRLLTLEQCRVAVDKSLHAGGAFSATIPLVTLYYGGFMDIDVVDPTRRGQDLFVLSKGPAVAAMASIYAEFGYFDRSVLHNSRSYESILNGHPGPLLYDRDYTFAFGKASVPFDPPDAAAVIVSSGRGVHEALAAASICVARGVNVRVIDMPSIDDEMLIHLCHSKALICLAEQNNGYILQNVLKVVYRHCPDVATSALQRILAINTLDADGRPRFIHSGTYEELIAAFGLAPPLIANAIIGRLQRPADRSGSREDGRST